MIGAALLARGSGGGGVSGRPPGRLPDADREPRGRHAARAGRAARGRPGRLRGHAPHARAARALRGAGDARLLPRAQRARADAGARRRGWSTARSWRWCRTPGMPLVSDPGYVLVAGCVAAGLEVEVLPGPSAAIAALVASGAAGRRAGASRASCRASAGRSRRCCGAPETLVAFESPRRVGASLAVLAELDPERPVAVCRELDEAARGGRARRRRRELAARYADEPPRGEVVLVIGAAPPRDGRRPGRDRRRPPADRGGRPRRARRPRSSPSSRAEPPTICTEP